MLDQLDGWKFLSEYDLDIKHIKGRENKVADALSRRVHEMHPTTISMYSLDLKSRILEAATADQHFVYVEGELQQGNSQQKVEDYTCKGMEFSCTKEEFMFLILWN